jgi:hypothetical protein
MKRTIGLTTCLLALCGSVLISGCSSVGTPKAGTACKVQFRRDALGSSGVTLPIGPTSDGVNGAVVSLNGKFKAMDKRWIIVQDERGERDFWIPRDMILCFSVLHQ